MSITDAFIEVPASLSISLPINMFSSKSLVAKRAQQEQQHVINTEKYVPRVSEAAQADLSCLKVNLVEERENMGEAIWDPSRLMEEDVDKFLQETYSLANDEISLTSSQESRRGERFIGMENALMLLKSSGYHISSAINSMNSRNLVWGNVRSLNDSWSEAEVRFFEDGMRAHYKDFSLIQKYMALNGFEKSHGQIIELYYKWKKSEYFTRWNESLDAMEESHDQCHDEMSDSETAISQSENSVEAFLPSTCSSPKRKNDYEFSTPPTDRKRKRYNPTVDFNLSFSLDDGLYNPFPSQKTNGEERVEMSPPTYRQEDNRLNHSWGAPSVSSCSEPFLEPLSFPLYFEYDMSENSLEPWNPV